MRPPSLPPIRPHPRPRGPLHRLSSPTLSSIKLVSSSSRLHQLRDLRSIWAKLLQVLYPPRSGSIGSGSDLLKEWDLWGPLVICLALAIMLSLDAPPDQSIQAFSMVISLVTLGSVVVTINAQLLGGKVYVQGFVARRGKRSS